MRIGAQQAIEAVTENGVRLVREAFIDAWTSHIAFDTNMLRPDGDSIAVYLPLKGQEGIFDDRITDFGKTISWLMDGGVEILQGPVRRRLLEDALRPFGVLRDGFELFCRVASLQELPDAIARLAQACARVSALVALGPTRVRRSFAQEVQGSFQRIGFEVEPNVIVDGRDESVRVDLRVLGRDRSALVFPWWGRYPGSRHTRANSIYRALDQLSMRDEVLVAVFRSEREDEYRKADMVTLGKHARLVPDEKIDELGRELGIAA